MFGLMKNVIKDAPPPSGAATLAELHAGCVIGLGFMPQKSVSGKRLPVAQVNSYLFNSDSFVAYRLVNDDTDVNLIVADEDDPTGTYLALSQRISPRLFDSIFHEHAPQYWFALTEGESLEVDPPALGDGQGWFAGRYTLAVSTSGRFLEGDYRLRKPADRSRVSRPFEYVLLVDEDNEYALEAEKYEDGTLNVFATIYRPATDIGEITRAQRAASNGSLQETQVDFTKPSHQDARTDTIESMRPLVLLGPVETIPHVSPLEDMRQVMPPSAPVPVEAKAPEPQESAIIEHVPPVDKNENIEKNVDILSQSVAELKKAEDEKREVFVTEEKALEAEVQEIEAKEEEAAPSALLLPTAEPAITALEAVTFVEAPQEAAPEISAALAAIADAVMAVPAEAPEAEQVIETSVTVHSKFGRIQPAMGQSEQGDTISCDARLAAKLIDEAQRNEMALSELIRKVIDLPARVQDKVLIPFALDPSESAELARRYHLAVGDMQGVKEQIVEELKRFAGEKA